MVEFLSSLLVLSPIVNRVVEVFKGWLATTEVDEDWRNVILLVAQVLVALVVFVGTYATAPFSTGTWIDKYPVLVIAMGTGLLALGSEVIYQVIDIAKALKSVGSKTTA